MEQRISGGVLTPPAPQKPGLPGPSVAPASPELAGGIVDLNAGVDSAGVPAADAEQKMRGLETSGRISLAVDFPTEGHVYHFQKVKAHAALELQFADPKVVTPLRNTGIFAMGALLLAFLGRLRRRAA